ncbi:mitochondrial carrier protein [Ophiocordyceps camponoti-floridani]|uniref:Mitochondrial carrier protein n=1 Tax=Ophiocordyceps camponoti-floridani TaxID=2030778 RepID=A0A8H4VE75_9HYPO|nr:mitochondrial carrier protein [Ophiocordyceps camponoti-floridani]
MNPDPPPEESHRPPRSNAATAASAASVRAVTAQLVAFYFRAPAKAFFRTRVDYLAYARSLHEAAQASKQMTTSSSSALAVLRLWMRNSTPAVLTSAIRHQGWAVVPRHILPPLAANVSVGAVLYATYIHTLARLHPESSRASKRTYPPPPPSSTFTAGFLAGGLQSVVAAPLDALQARFDHRQLVGSSQGRPPSLWSFGADKLREIGLRGVLAGWSLSFAKDSLGSAVFFTSFEYVKAQAYYRFVTWYYGGLAKDIVDTLALKRPPHTNDEASPTVIRPHYAIEPMFLLLAGASASFTQQLILHPLTHLQLGHWDRLEDLDAKAALSRRQPRERPWSMLRDYYRAYRDTWAACVADAEAHGRGPLRWLYRGFWSGAVRQVPSTSAGLIIFELVRRKYGFGADEVRITKDGYDILLT